MVAAADGFDSDSEIDDLIASVEEVPDSDHTYASASKVDESDIQNLLEIALTDYVDTPENIGPSIFPSPDSTPSEPGKGKIRHVGGYCVAKVRYRLTKSMRNCFFVPGMQPYGWVHPDTQRRLSVLDFGWF